MVGDVKSEAIIQPRKKRKAKANKVGANSSAVKPVNKKAASKKDKRQSKKGMKLAKSVYDAGWFELKRQLTYKCKHAGCRLDIVNEKYTTQRCSGCGEISETSPKGRAALGVREWTCARCGTWHDRDINAAKNILAVGLDRLEAGIPLV